VNKATTPHVASESKYIYIRTNKPKRYKVKNISVLKTKRKSPKPHKRRGHYRHYQSGAVVWIETSYIGLKELADKKIYKVKTGITGFEKTTDQK